MCVFVCLLSYPPSQEAVGDEPAPADKLCSHWLGAGSGLFLSVSGLPVGPELALCDPRLQCSSLLWEDGALTRARPQAGCPSSTVTESDGRSQHGRQLRVALTAVCSLLHHTQTPEEEAANLQTMLSVTSEN